MEYYLAKSGAKVGPLSQFKLVEMLREGEVSPEEKLWHQGMDSWLPASEIPSLQSTLQALEREKLEATAPPLPETPAPTKRKFPVANEVRPLTRFWARYFDYTVVLVIVVIFSEFEIPKVDSGASISDLMAKSYELAESDEYRQLMKMVIYSIPIWHVIESIMISVFGTTPGKALFGIHIVSSSGSKLSLYSSIYRSFLVYILGVGLFYFSLLTFATMTFSFVRLMTRGICPWDQILDLKVKHPPLSFGRILLAILAFITLMMLQNLNFS
ncbi:MAG: RDD family protein [Verrucomicrobiales bacterium]|nr:RDD family protein [Verrucomicrobiales bacterium]